MRSIKDQYIRLRDDTVTTPKLENFGLFANSMEVQLGGRFWIWNRPDRRPLVFIKENVVITESFVNASKTVLAFFAMIGSIFLIGSKIKKGKISI